MRKINNPDRENAGYHCFGCAPQNPFGLKMEFFEDGDEVVSEWEPNANYQSYENVLHGGIQMTLLDEVACWCMMVKIGSAGFTQQMDVQFLKNVFLSRGKIVLRARIEKREGDLAFIRTELYDQEGVLRTTALAVYFVYPEKIARKRLQYPGREKF
ncbi:MAG: PaaI family thioesterase [Bacteroidales bacterium]|nr:PaaI family thioesterase [Bacteroidales bacterium]